ncbi:MAG TPA: aromatic ring-hydroxylating dioxygenase subunit alpha [Hypericibacter adhaerens]|uniref:aromatic ring-hydroxylating oxygenase subunit alpha n=1 Tax=Hypericibacter adhaerens TaxID=2602016 RepID=UPI002C054352|nr:aromatic ring-hydroxylating dioxygenase subunit alpha [Hypericibacter adhaerens]HWA42667.1 aromatic ring-hydroxylating dioxygenase subunit alpha [Hypericibacter adhaerens]
MATRAGYEDRADLGNVEPEDILSPRHYAAVRRGGRLMRSLPLWCYTSERFWEAEKERIFLRSWNLIEREEIVPKAGDYHSMSFLGVPMIVVRGKDEKVRVFANTCRHRGAMLATGSGNCKAFRCPYHFWSYGLDGRFIGAPNYNDPEGRPLIDGTNKEEFGLAEIESGTWGGFIFIRFKEGPQTLEQHLGAFVESLASHKLEDMACARKVVYEMDANWKCFVENYIDAYHIPYVHKDSLAQWKSKEAVLVPSRGQEYVVFVRHDEGSQLLLPFPGYDGFPPMPQIDPDRTKGTYFVTLRPGMMMTLGNDGALLFQSEPISAKKSRLTVSSLFPKSYFGREDFERLSQNYYRRNDIVVVEDKEIALRQFAGIQSPYARIARLCSQETDVQGLANWIVDQVVTPETGETIAAE